MNLFEINIQPLSFGFVIWCDIVRSVHRFTSAVFLDRCFNFNKCFIKWSTGYCGIVLAIMHVSVIEWVFVSLFFFFVVNWNCSIMIHMMHFTHMFKSTRKKHWERAIEKKTHMKQVRDVFFFYFLKFNCKRSHAHCTYQWQREQQFLADLPQGLIQFILQLKPPNKIIYCHFTPWKCVSVYANAEQTLYGVCISS